MSWTAAEKFDTVNANTASGLKFILLILRVNYCLSQHRNNNRACSYLSHITKQLIYFSYKSELCGIFIHTLQLLPELEVFNAPLFLPLMDITLQIQ